MNDLAVVELAVEVIASQIAANVEVLGWTYSVVVVEASVGGGRVVVDVVVVLGVVVLVVVVTAVVNTLRIESKTLRGEDSVLVASIGAIVEGIGVVDSDVLSTMNSVVVRIIFCSIFTSSDDAP